MGSFQLVFTNYIDEIRKDVGENIFFEDLPTDYQVYLFYYPSTRSKKELANYLRSLGEKTGRNLFVNLANYDDPNYDEVRDLFKIRNFPTIIITAVDTIASPPDELSTAYVRIDDKELLDSPDLALDCVEKTFNLFISGKITEAIRVKKHDERMFRIRKLIKGALQGLKDYLTKWDISFSFITGVLTIKPRGSE